MTQMNLPMKQKWTLRQGTDLCLPEGEECKRDGWESGVSRCKLLCRKWIINKSSSIARGLYSISRDKP